MKGNLNKLLMVAALVGSVATVVANNDVPKRIGYVKDRVDSAYRDENAPKTASRIKQKLSNGVRWQVAAAKNAGFFHGNLDDLDAKVAAAKNAGFFHGNLDDLDSPDRAKLIGHSVLLVFILLSKLTFGL